MCFCGKITAFFLYTQIKTKKNRTYVFTYMRFFELEHFRPLATNHTRSERGNRMWIRTSAQDTVVHTNCLHLHKRAYIFFLFHNS